MTLSLLFNLAGGVGLILLGMKLMTDGLKLAGGGVLKRALREWTGTPIRGLISGFTITSAVQASGAVTLAAIGFVNAGLMTLSSAVWVVYGSNIGTTTTAWIVAFLGLKLKIKVLALPFIAAGTGLWLSGGLSRRAAVGEALAGFGLFFLGVEAMQEAFSGISGGLDVTALNAEGILGILLFAGTGFLLTFIMQSSSAAIALVLAAAAQGVIPIEAAAASVIGANVGTTTTAAIATIGATSNAKRLAWAHVLFNLMTGAVAFFLLPFMVGLILDTRTALGMDADPASVLALFHTLFNLLGVIVMWPFTRRLVRFLSSRFRTAEEDEATPRYLDDTVVRTPSLAMNALILEIGRLSGTALRMGVSLMECEKLKCMEAFHKDRLILNRLMEAVTRFASKLRKEGMPEDTADLLPDALRAARYFTESAHMAAEAAEAKISLAPMPKGRISESYAILQRTAITTLLGADTSDGEFTAQHMNEQINEFEIRYQEAKQILLEAGTDGTLPVDVMVEQLDFLSRIRRMIEQSVKGAWLLGRLNGQDGSGN